MPLRCPSRPSRTRPVDQGGVFLFDENDVADCLAALDNVTDGALRWSETAGLKQVVRTIDINDESSLSWIRSDYEALGGTEAA